MTKAFLVSCMLLALAAIATPARAGFALTISGNGAIVAAPPSAVPGAFENDAYQVWNETQGSLGADVALDYDGTPGTYNGNSVFTGTVLTAGTKYGTTMVQLDPVNDSIDHLSGSATITFSNKILGIALRNASLDGTDSLGAGGTTYPTGYTPSLPDTRGIDFRNNDQFTVSADGKSLVVKLTANFNGFDELRVFTSGVPEPASLVVWSVLGAVVAGGAWWRRPPAV